MLSREEILQEIKRRVLAVEPQAEVWLYGSRARGDYNDNSDWDLIVIVPKETDYRTEDRLMDVIIDYGLSIGELFTPLIYSKKQWDRMHGLPFRLNVENDKINI